MSGMGMGSNSSSSGAMGGMGGMGGMTNTTNSSAPGMSMDMGPNSCKVSMLGNWNVLHTCFLTSSWHVRTAAQFGGTVVFVFLLVVIAEMLRRVGREYDRRIVAAHRVSSGFDAWTEGEGEGELEGGKGQPGRADVRSRNAGVPKADTTILRSVLPGLGGGSSTGSPPARLRPTVMQQLVRSLLHAMPFTAAYIIMLFAMYYNGFVLVAICVGGFAGFFVASWDTLPAPNNGHDDNGSPKGDGCCC